MDFNLLHREYREYYLGKKDFLDNILNIIIKSNEHILKTKDLFRLDKKTGLFFKFVMLKEVFVFAKVQIIKVKYSFHK